MGEHMSSTSASRRVGRLLLDLAVALLAIAIVLVGIGTIGIVGPVELVLVVVGVVGTMVARRWWSRASYRRAQATRRPT